MNLRLIKTNYKITSVLIVFLSIACNQDKDMVNVEPPILNITDTEGKKAPVKLHVSASGGEEAFSISSNGNWAVSKHGTDTEWVNITPEKGNTTSTITFSIVPNTSQEPRELTLRFAVNDLQTNAMTINQLGYAPSIAVLPAQEEPFVLAGGDITFTVTTNDDAWEYTLPNEVDWLVEKEKTSTTLTLTVIKNGDKILPILPRTAHIKFSLVDYPNVSEIVKLDQEGKELKLDGYKIKRYGTKTWMIENLKEAGENGELGSIYNNDPIMKALYGRYYSWHEAMTGIPNATASDHNFTWGASGIDDMGNPYILDGTAANSYNIQIQGACPEGWHVANMNDWYDLLVAIKEEYNVPGSSIDEIKVLKQGYIIPWTREEGFKASVAMGAWGVIGPYLKGSKLINEGGLWGGNSVSEYNYGTWGTFPLFVSLSDEIEFNILPSGRFDGSKWVEEGTTTSSSASPYSYHFAAYLKSDDRPLRITIGGTNANLSNGLLSISNKICIRCVANY